MDDFNRVIEGYEMKDFISFDRSVRTDGFSGIEQRYQSPNLDADPISGVKEPGGFCRKVRFLLGADHQKMTINAGPIW